mgnify:CR=1 FL=1
MSTRKRACEDDDSNDDNPRKVRAITHQKTCSYARNLTGSEAERDRHGHLIWYCSRCSHRGITTLRRVRTHLSTKHNIRIIEEPTLFKQAINHKLNAIFDRQKQRQEGRDFEQERHLKKAINQPAFEESLAQFITLHNLPHRIGESA